jgi:Chalcone isomerase-like
MNKLAKFFFLISFMAMFSTLSNANVLPEVVAKEHAGLNVRGEGVLRFFGMKVYEARLWAPAKSLAKSISPGDPFALELVYDMSVKGREIAERSTAEMRKVGYSNEAKLKAWGEEMLRIFPDIKKGESLIGVSIPGKGAKFYSREKLIASADDPEFAKAFFDIWLSEKTSEPKLRERLLGPQ